MNIWYKIGAGLLVLVGMGALVNGVYLIGLAAFAGSGVALTMGKRQAAAQNKMLTTEASRRSLERNLVKDEKMLAAIAEPDYDPANITVRDLRKGFTFDYEMNSWKVEAHSFLYFNEGPAAIKHKIIKRAKVENATEDLLIQFLRDDAQSDVWIFEKVNIFSIDRGMDTKLNQTRFKPDSSYVYEGVEFFREPLRKGYHIAADKSYSAIDSWIYLDAKLNQSLMLDYWGEHQLEAFSGRKVDPMEFTGILPAPDNQLISG